RVTPVLAETVDPARPAAVREVVLHGVVHQLLRHRIPQAAIERDVDAEQGTGLARALGDFQINPGDGREAELFLELEQRRDARRHVLQRRVLGIADEGGYGSRDGRYGRRSRSYLFYVHAGRSVSCHVALEVVRSSRASRSASARMSI